jgi:hypothetical protein
MAEYADSEVDDARSLYAEGSIADSDEDFLDDFASPTDGYFQPRQHPEDLYVTNPAVEAPSDDKQSDADDERAASSSRTIPASPGTSIQYESPLHHQPQSLWTQDSTPIFDAGPVTLPPPDYLSATANRAEEQRQARALQMQVSEQDEDEEWNLRGRETFGSEHPLVRNGILTDTIVYAGHQPGDLDGSRPQLAGRSSTSDTEESTNENTGLISHYSDVHEQSSWDKKSSILWRRAWCLFIAIIVLFCCLALVLTTIAVEGAYRTSHAATSFQDESANEPVLEHDSQSGCKWANYQLSTVALDWEKNLSMHEAITVRDPNVRLFGHIHISKPTPEQRNITGMTIEVATTRGLVIEDIRDTFSVEKGDFVFTSPKYHSDGEPACISMTIKLSIVPDIWIENLIIRSSNFDITIDDGELFEPRYFKWMDYWAPGLIITNTTTFETDRGSITGNGLNSAVAQVSTVEGSITGMWQLGDVLNVTSVSGDVHIQLQTPKSNWGWYPGRFWAFNRFGNIRTEILPNDRVGNAGVEDRDYISSVETESGSIAGTYLLGSAAAFKTKSGDIVAQIVPVGSNFTNRTVHSQTGSGDSYIYVLEPVFPLREKSDQKRATAEVDPEVAVKAVWDSLFVEQESESGRITNVVPPSWTGSIHATAQRGKLWQTAYCFEQDSHTTQSGRERLSVHRGTSNSQVTLYSETGSVGVDAVEEGAYCGYNPKADTSTGS